MSEHQVPFSKMMDGLSFVFAVFLCSGVVLATSISILCIFLFRALFSGNIEQHAPRDQ